eukprot:jgi/Tetstr1/426346/TSEL_016658.t1
MGSEPGSETSQRWRGPFGALLAPRSLVDPAQPARRGLIPATPAHCVVASSVSEAAECLPEYDGLNLASYMAAGAMAGVVEHTVMFPVDTVKTRMQALSHPGQQLNSKSLRRAVKVILKREGVAGLYNGVAAVALGAGPSHALYFATYEMGREFLGANQEGHRPLETAVAGTMATAVNDFCMTPWDVIKQRLQVAGTPYSGVMDCARRTLSTHGLGAFFKSYQTTLLMNVPFVAIHFPIYESGKKMLTGGDDEAEGLLVEAVAGGAAGGIAAALTNPLDVVKTRLQTEGVQSRVVYSASAVQTLRTILAEEGQAALWAGVKARVLFHIPAAAVSWCTYETMKSMLLRQP